MRKSFYKIYAAIVLVLLTAGCSDVFRQVPWDVETPTGEPTKEPTMVASPTPIKPTLTPSEQASQSRNKLEQHSMKFMGKLNGIVQKDLENYFIKAYKPSGKSEDKIHCQIDTKSIKRINIKNQSKAKNDLIVAASVWSGDDNQVTPSARDYLFILLNDNAKAEKLNELDTIYDDKNTYSVVNLNDILGFSGTLDNGGVEDLDGDGAEELVVTSDIKSSTKDVYAPIKVMKYSKNKFIEILSHEYEVTVKNKMYQFSSKYEIVPNPKDSSKKDIVLSYTETIYKANYEKDKEIKDKITFRLKNGVMIPDKIKEFPSSQGDYKLSFGKHKNNESFVR